MKIGRTLEDLAREITRQAEVKKDYVAGTENMEMLPSQQPSLILGGTLRLGLKPIAHAQIAGHLAIPKPYYDRMLAEAPALLADNVNTWFKRNPTKRMVRTLDGSARAFLSNGFRPLDNVDLLEATLPRIVDLGVEVLSCEVTDSKLYLKVVDSRIRRDLPTGAALGAGHQRFDTVSPALVISNSEVGAGALSVLTSVWTGGCTNLMVISERSTRKYHVGARVDIGDEVYAMLSDQTRAVTDEALWRQLGDVVAGAFDVARFDAQVAKIAATAENGIEADPIKVVEVTAKKYGLNDGERSSVLQHLIRGGSLTQYGLHAAITRTAEDLADYDRASQFEQLGGKIIELPRAEWRALATAAPERLAA
jgi:hypothetical protein